MSEFGYTVVDEQMRLEGIINFIRNHPGCTAEDIDKLEGKDRGNIPGHTTLFKMLKDLKSENIIKKGRSRNNKRNIPLFINENNQLVTIPEEINVFEQIFKQFIHKVVEYQSPIISSLNTLLDKRLELYKEQIGKKMEGLTMHELAEISPDVDLHTDLEFLSVQVSPLVKAIQILNAFMRIYTIRSIVEWPIRINDKNTVSALVALVSSKISKLQVWVMKILNPLLQTFYKRTGKLLLSITEGPIDPDKVLAYYKYFDLDGEVEAVLKHISKIGNSTNLVKEEALPLEEWSVISPSEVGLNTLKELFDPEEYYEEEFGEEEWAIIKESMSEDQK